MVIIKNTEQQDGIRRSADVLANAFSQISRLIKPGTTTLDIDQCVKKTVEAAGASPAFLGYNNFPASLCTSVNNQVIHGIPNAVPLDEGDIVGCDIGVILNGYFSDACKTFAIGKISERAQTLLDTTQQALYAAIDACRPGNRIRDIAKAVTRVVEPKGFGIVYDYCGHGVGLELHEDPQIPNYYPCRGSNPRLKPGMVLAIEPMVNIGTADVDVLEDGWTVVTADNSLSAHFEHTVLVTTRDPEILTSWG